MDRFGDFVKYMENNSFSPNTIQSYLYDIRAFIDFFKEKYDEEWNRILYDIAEDVYYEITDSVQSYKKFGIEFIGKN